MQECLPIVTPATIADAMADVIGRFSQLLQTVLDFVFIALHTLSGLRPCDILDSTLQLIPQRSQVQPISVWNEGAVGELECEIFGTDTAPPLST